MDQLKGALTAKLGPFPGWAWAGLTAVGLFIAWPHLSGLFAAAPADATASPDPGQQPPDDNPPLPQPAPSPHPQPPPPPPPTPARHKTYTVVHGDTLWSIAKKFLGNGARWPEIWALSHFRSGNPNLIYPGEVAVLPLPAGGAAGIGGASIGSRSADLMQYFHPALSRSVRYPQLVRAAGGPAAHRTELHRVAAQTGLHPARLIAVNPHYRGFIRVA